MENFKKLAVSASEIKMYLSKIKAQKQLILLDACHSGGALKTLSSTRGAPEEKAASYHPRGVTSARVVEAYILDGRVYGSRQPTLAKVESVDLRETCSNRWAITVAYDIVPA